MHERMGYDVVIVGGAVIGSAVAYFLMSSPDFKGRVLVVEKDWSYSKCATALSSSSIRVQFSNPVNVQMSQFGAQFIRDFAQTMDVDGSRPDLGFLEQGYLFLGATDEQVAILQSSHATQKALGADVELLAQEELKKLFPHLHVEDIKLASYGRSGEGWFDNTGMMNGFRAKARQLGATFIQDEVIGLDTEQGRVSAVRLKSGTSVACGAFVNAAGCNGPAIARMVGIDLPVEPRKRSLFVFASATPPDGRLPLMIDPSGVFVRPEGQFFLAGCPPVEDPAVSSDDFDVRHEEFEEIIWPTLGMRSPAFEAIKLMRFWAGQYDFNTLDHNVIVGPHDQLANFYFANGFSGHGLQQSPAIGRGLAELLTVGRYTSLDLSPLGFERVRAGRRFVEQAVI